MIDVGSRRLRSRRLMHDAEVRVFRASSSVRIILYKKIVQQQIWMPVQMWFVVVRFRLGLFLNIPIFDF